LIFNSGETPLHIAIFYNDIHSVELLVKHGVDVNQRVVGGLFSRDKTETNKRRKIRLSNRNKETNYLISLKNANPESRFIFVGFSLFAKINIHLI